MDGLKLNFYTSVFIILLVGSCCDAFEHIDIEVTNDENYPQLISVSNLRYRVVNGNAVEVSCDVDIQEKISYGTKVIVNVSSEFPYAKLLDKMDPDLCFFVKKEVPLYRQLLSHSNFPERCPIEAGTYKIRNYYVDLSKYPLLLRGFPSDSSLTVHKGGRVLSKLNIKCIAQ